MNWKLALVPIASLTVIGVAAVLTPPSSPAPETPTCIDIAPAPEHVYVLPRHHFAKPPPAPPAPPEPPHVYVTA